MANHGKTVSKERVWVTTKEMMQFSLELNEAKLTTWEHYKVLLLIGDGNKVMTIYRKIQAHIKHIKKLNDVCRIMEVLIQV